MQPDKLSSETNAYESALSEQPTAEDYVLRLFVTGSTPRSARAIQNLRAICDEQLSGHYDLEIVDIYQHPEQAKPEQVVVMPTLIKSLPLPVRRIIGDLSNQQRLLAGLDIVHRSAGHPEPGRGR